MKNVFFALTLACLAISSPAFAAEELALATPVSPEISTMEIVKSPVLPKTARLQQPVDLDTCGWEPEMVSDLHFIEEQQARAALAEKLKQQAAVIGLVLKKNHDPETTASIQ